MQLCSGKSHWKCSPSAAFGGVSTTDCSENPRKVKVAPAQSSRGRDLLPKKLPRAQLSLKNPSKESTPKPPSQNRCARQEWTGQHWHTAPQPGGGAGVAKNWFKSLQDTRNCPAQGIWSSCCWICADSQDSGLPGFTPRLIPAALISFRGHNRCISLEFSPLFYFFFQLDYSKSTSQLWKQRGISIKCATVPITKHCDVRKAIW